MNLKNDYFLLYHGKNAQDIESVSLRSTLGEHFPIFSLILSIRKNSFDTLFKLTTFRKLARQIYTKEITRLGDLYPLQSSILSYLNKSSDYTTQTLLEHIEYLKTKDVLPLENYNRLISLFEHLVITDNVEPDAKSDVVQNLMSFQDKRELLIEQIKRTKSLFTNKLLQNDLEMILDYLQSQTFSIGITGVINSGKSTMLNALIGKEILGSSVVPETANLTIIKYAQPKAEVYYWNEEEWQAIVTAGESRESIALFVRETKKIFAEELGKYVTQEGYKEIIKVEDISQYTSVKESHGKCNLVKYVKLYYDLDFLKDGIEIVDTPGLDDPVVQREEITKEYLSHCDLMLHLMNVNQSATHKDVAFIVDAILYQHISRVLIVITQVDSVTPKEVQEVVSYTKKAIKEELEKLNKGARVAYILEHIDFIPLSAKVALSHRVSSDNITLEGMSLQESGILELENYLDETLFSSKSGRSELIIRSATTKLEEYIQRQLHLYRYELEVLSHSKDELEADLLQKRKNRESFVHLLSEDIEMYKEESIGYIVNLTNFLQESFIDLKSVIHQRVFSDISYTYKQTKSLPKEQRIEVIVQTALKDGVIDILRDYRYKLLKKEEMIFANFEKKFIMFSTQDENQLHNSVDIDAFFKDSFTSGIMTFSIDIFVSSVIKKMRSTKASHYETLHHALLKIIDDELRTIIEMVSQKLQKEAFKLIEELYEILFSDVASTENKLLEEEKLITALLGGMQGESLENERSVLQKIEALDSMVSKVSL